MTSEFIDDDDEDVLDAILDALAAHGIVEVDPNAQYLGAYKLTALGEALDAESVKALVNLPTGRDRAN